MEKIIKIEKTFKSILVFPIKLILLFAFLPLVLIYNTSGLKDLTINFKNGGFSFSLLKPKSFKVLAKRFLKSILILFTLFPIWFIGYIVVGALVSNLLGLTTEPVMISGTGSMYPTFPKGQGKTPKKLSDEIVDTPGMLPYPNGIVIGGKRFFGHQISRGDIVLVKNEKTMDLTKKLYGNPSGWVKRVIAIAGDAIELKGGITYLNNKPLKETYTAKARSTFGEEFLGECKKVTVPENSVFVMGDNRKGSGDSREIGFFNLNDVNHVIPFDSQKGTLDKNWRNTTNDFEESSKIRINKQKYLELLNEKRREVGVQLLKYQPKLELSADKRGKTVLEYNDFSFEATKSGYTMTKAMADSNYSNIVYGESIRLGYFEADELIENQFEFPESKKFLLKSDVQEIGIAEVEGNLNGCPSQVVVLHLAGYVPPNYSQSDTNGWKKLLSNLREVYSSWEDIKNYSLTYTRNKQDADRLLEIMNYRIGMIQTIIGKMENRQWLNSTENNYIRNEDLILYNEQQEIAKKLNGFRWQR